MIQPSDRDTRRCRAFRLLRWLLLCLTALAPPAAEAAGPWRGQVVDAETHQPVSGAVVLGVWYRRVHGHPALGFGRPGFAAAAEAVTGADGRFTLPGRFFAGPPLRLPVDGPELGVAAPGYGGWRFGGTSTLTGRGARIELRPLPTPEARRAYLERRGGRDGGGVWVHADGPWNPIDLPHDQAPCYEATLNGARADLGLPPIGVGYPYQGPPPPAPADPIGGVTLRGASGLAIDRAGQLYVADTEHHRIVTFSPSLAPQATWGRFGRAPGEFQFPRGIAVAPDGTVYVADSGNHRIQHFTAEGRFLGQWGERRFSELGGRFRPTDLAVTSRGEVVVFAGERVHRFSPSGRLRGSWGEPWQFDPRSGVAIDREGQVIGISERPAAEGPPVRMFDATGRPVGAWGQRGRDVGQLFDPRALAVDQAGRVYIADGDPFNPRVMRFDASGRLLRQWDRQTGGPGLQRPTALALGPDGTVYVADAERPGLQTLGPALAPPGLGR